MVVRSVDENIPIHRAENTETKKHVRCMLRVSTALLFLTVKKKRFAMVRRNNNSKNTRDMRL